MNKTILIVLVVRDFRLVLSEFNLRKKNNASISDNIKILHYIRRILTPNIYYCLLNLTLNFKV